MDGGGAFTSSTPGGVEEAETHLAVAPDGTIAAVWIGYLSTGQLFIGYTFSKDGGTTWTPVEKILDPRGLDCGDPAIAADASSNFYASFIGFDINTGSQVQIFESVAAAGTTTFGAPSQVTDPADPASYDKPWTLIGNDGNVVTTYSRFPNANPNESDIIAARGTVGAGGSLTWSRQTIFVEGLGDSSTNFANLAFPCISRTANGRLWVTFYDTTGITLRWSDDNGKSWPAANVSVVSSNPENNFDDPTCAGNGSDVWVAYSLTKGSAFANPVPMEFSIPVAHSGNGGTSFDKGTVDAGAGTPGVEAMDLTHSAAGFHPFVVLEAGGALDVEYYGGAGEGDTNASVLFTRSTNAGVSFGSATTLKHPLTLTGDRAVAGWLGDYLGTTTASGNLYTTFTFNTANTSQGSHVGFASASLP